MTDGIEWPDWVETIDVYRNGREGQFCCNAWVVDDLFWAMGSGDFIGWGDTVTDAIKAAILAGETKAREVKVPE